MKTIKLTSEEYIELLENERKELLRDISRKDKETERLKQREKECIDHYLVANKYASEMETKVIELNNIIKEVREYILQHCEIIRFEDENVDKVGKVEGIPILEILDKGSDKNDKS